MLKKRQPFGILMKFFKIIFYLLCVCMGMGCTGGGKISCESWFSPSVTWGLETEFKSPSVSSAFTRDKPTVWWRNQSSGRHMDSWVCAQIMLLVFQVKDILDIRYLICTLDSLVSGDFQYNPYPSNIPGYPNIAWVWLLPKTIPDVKFSEWLLAVLHPSCLSA